MRRVVAVVVCFLLVSVMLGASAVVFAGKPPDKGKPSIGTEYLIDTEGWPECAGIHENTIYWITKSDLICSVWMYYLGEDGVPDQDPTEQREIIVTFELEDTGSWIHEAMEVWEDKLVFNELTPIGGYQNYDGDVYMVHEAQGDWVLTLLEGGPDLTMGPDAYGDVVVYTHQVFPETYPDDPETTFAVFHSSGDDNEWGTVDDLVHKRVGHSYAFVWGEKVSVQGGVSQIYTIDTDGIPVDSVPFDYPVWSIWEDCLGYVIHEPRTGRDIYLYDMATGETIPIATGRKNESGPKIDGNLVLYKEYDSKGTNALFHDMSSGDTHNLTSTGDGYPKSIYGDHMLYTDLRDGVGSLYLFVVNLGGGGQSAGVRAGRDGFSLLPNRPNPVREKTAIRFTLAECTPVTVTVHDAAGRTVAIVADREFTAGTHEIEWIPDVPYGTYFCRLEAGGHSASRRMTVVR